MKVVEYEEYEEEEEYTEEPKKKKVKFGFYGYLVIFLAIAILIISFLLLFYMQRVEVTGTEYSSEEETVQWIQKEPGSFNTLFVLLRHQFTEVPQLPFAETTEVWLKNPWTIKVRVYEKKITGYLEAEGQYIYFDKDGMVVIKSGQIIEGIPRIEGIEVKSAEQYQILPVADPKVFDYIADVTQTAEKCELLPDRIVYTGMDVALYFGTVCVQLGHQNLNDRMMQIAPILERLSGHTGTLHLENYDERSEVISFQEDLPAETEEGESVPNE